MSNQNKLAGASLQHQLRVVNPWAAPGSKTSHVPGIPGTLQNTLVFLHSV